jgi:hypothetical protein
VVSGLEVFAKEERDCAQVKGYEYSILPLSSKKYFRIVACAREVEDMFAVGESCDVFSRVIECDETWPLFPNC